MHPSRIFQESLVENSEICNFCFRRKAERERFPYPEEELPDFVSPRIFPSDSSTKDYPPPESGEIGRTIEIDYYNRESGGWASDANVGGEGRKENIRGMISKPKIVCECGRMDDRRINGSFPDDWEDRSKDSFLDISKRVYHRLDEDGFDIDFDNFMNSVEKYKISDEYEFGDYEILQDAVADAVVVRKQDV